MNVSVRIIGGLSVSLIIIATSFFVVSSESPAEASTLEDYVHGRNTQFQRFTKEFGVETYSNVKQPGVIIQNIVAIAFGFLGLIAVIMIIYAGFLWLTAGGEEEKATKGRTLLFQAVIGLIIILSAYMIAYFVLRNLILAIVG